jgi:hypothetical protein
VRSRGVAFAAVVAACVLLGGGWVLVAALRNNSSTTDVKVKVEKGPPAEASLPEPPAPPKETSNPGPNAPVVLNGELMVRAVDPRDNRLNGRVTRVSLDGGGGTADAGKLACQRVYFAAGRGLCLALQPSGVEYRAKIFDSSGTVRREFTLDGLPSRARVSPGGRYGSVTTFVSGDSYTNPGEFSTRTRIVDMGTGKRVADLEQFEAFRDGRRFDSPDFNYWGVTFTDDEDTFYATLATGDHHYLVQGSLRERQVQVLRDNVECPSLSPDFTRLVYKKRIDKAGHWRLHVLELATMKDVALSERRSIDDQAEWLDNDTVVYGDGKDVWAVRADGGGRPRRVLSRASSPARLG